MTIHIDRSKCSGIGLCEYAASSVFEVGDDGIARLIDERPGAAGLSEVEDAISKCPTGAISVGG